MVDQINLLDLVASFQDAVNRKDINEVLAMFTEDAEFELIGIAKYSGEFMKTGVDNFLSFIAIISIQLGLFNLFPIHFE